MGWECRPGAEAREKASGQGLGGGFSEEVISDQGVSAGGDEGGGVTQGGVGRTAGRTAGWCPGP